MEEPVRLLLTNAAAAALIAALAWAASLTVRRASVVHALCLLALLKLVTPPIAPLPLLPSWSRPALLSERLAPTVVSMPTHEHAWASDATPSPTALVEATRRTEARATLPILATMAGSRAPIAVPTADTAARERIAPRDWRLAAGTALGAGALAILALAALRFVRFGRLLADARPAPAPIANRVSALAARIGLRRAPHVRLVAAGVPPMIWPARGGPLLLLPERLVPALRPDELDALLAHELAHVRRRDHWVRLVEIAATVLFWWYPVTWWARRALRRAEERCCDEWVLRLLPRSAEAYANSLLKSLAFVADRPLPGVASGAGPVEDLESRLKEILMTRPVPPLARPLRFALAATAVLGLAVFPTHAQSSAGNDDPAARPAPVAKPALPAKTSPGPAPAAKPAAAAPRAREASPATPGPVEGGVPGGVVAGVPGGVVGGVPGGVVGGVPGAVAEGVPAPRPVVVPLAAPTAAPATPAPALAPVPVAAPMAPLGPIPQAPPTPVPAIAATDGPREAARHAIEDERRAIEEERRRLHQQELELARKQIELEAQAEQAELRAEADRLRAAGKAEDALGIEKQVRLNVRRVELQKRQLELEVERAALDAKLEAEVRAHQDRLEAVEESGREGAEEDAHRELKRAEAKRRQAELDLQQKQQAIEQEAAEAEKQIHALVAEDQVRAARDATDDLVRSITEQIDSLKRALAHAPAQKAEVDHEIQRLQAALDALKAGGTPKAVPSKTPRP